MMRGRSRLVTPLGVLLLWQVPLASWATTASTGSPRAAAGRVGTRSRPQGGAEHARRLAHRAPVRRRAHPSPSVRTHNGNEVRAHVRDAASPTLREEQVALRVPPFPAARKAHRPAGIASSLDEHDSGPVAPASPARDSGPQVMRAALEQPVPSPGGGGHGGTAVSEEELSRIRSILNHVRRKRPPGVEAPPGKLPLTLEQAVELALEKNLRLHITGLNADAFETDISRAKAIFHPLLGGRVYVATRPISDAQYDWRIAAAQLEADILAVTAQTKAAYYNTALADLVIDAVQDALARDERLIEASNALFKAGLVTKRDVYSAEIIRAEDTDTLTRTEGERELAQNVLSDVLGVPIGTEFHLRHEALDFQPIQPELEAWIGLAHQRR